MSVGSVLPGGYCVAGWLARGGVADAFRVHDVDGAALVAKVMHAHLVDDAVCVARFEREARIVAELRTPHFVAFRTHGTLGRVPFLITEPARGDRLADVLAGASPMPVSLALAIAQGVVSALQVLHAKGIVHRDVKPTNVFVYQCTQSVAVQLIDLGSAVASDVDAADPGFAGDRLTPAGTTMVTPQYACRELLTGQWSRDPRGDLYAASVLLFQMVTGHLPFDHDDRGELLRRIATTAAPPVTVFGEQPMWLTSLLARALSVDPDERYSTAEALRTALNACAANSP